MACFVLVHGGGHGGWCWRPVARRLRAMGHEVHAPTLSGTAERRHRIAGVDLAAHVAEVADLLFHEDLRDVVLAGHSYGGMVVTGAADRALARVGCLAYLDAAIPHDGETLLDVSPGLRAFRDVRAVDGVDLGLWPDATAAAIYGLVDPQLAAWALPRLTPHPWACFEQALHLADPRAVAALPRAIVNCRQTLLRRPEHLRSRWAEAEYLREIDTGHDLMLTAPDAVAAMLDQIAALAAHRAGAG